MGEVDAGDEGDDAGGVGRAPAGWWRTGCDRTAGASAAASRAPSTLRRSARDAPADVVDAAVGVPTGAA